MGLKKTERLTSFGAVPAERLIGLRTQPVPAVERGMRILEAIGQSASGITLAEIARRCQIARSSTHSILCTLERGGWVLRNPRDHRYALTRRLTSLASNASVDTTIRDAALPVLRAVSARTRLTAHLGILEQDEAVIVAKVQGPHRMPPNASWTGMHVPLHCTALGKALILGWRQDDVERLAANRGLRRHNENTISNPRRLQDDLQSARQRTYSIDDEEDVLGVRCIAMPVYDSSGSVEAAISLTGTVQEIDTTDPGSLVDQLRQAVTAVGGELEQLAGCLPKPASDVCSVRSRVSVYDSREYCLPERIPAGCPES